MQDGERLPGFGEGVEIVRHRDARQLLSEVVREALAVVGCVQDAVDVIEDSVLGYGVVGVMRSEYGERGIGDVVDALQTRFVIQQPALFLVPPVVSIAWKALAECDMSSRSGIVSATSAEKGLIEPTPGTQIARFTPDV